MSTKLADQEAFRAFGRPALVYVRPMSGAQLLKELPRPNDTIMPDAVYFGVRRADGELLAAHPDRKAAFTLAEAHALDPVSVH
jgi:hypothetical protein